jgi:hypothetical protein
MLAVDDIELPDQIIGVVWLRSQITYEEQTYYKRFYLFSHMKTTSK